MGMLGYDPVMRYKRQAAYRKMDELRNKADSQFTEVTVGSKGEGLTSVYESDTDILLIPNNVLILDVNDEQASVPPTVKVLRMDYNACHPGHTLLKITGTGPNLEEWQSEAVMDLGNGQKCLANTVVTMMSVNINDTTTANRSGPAVGFTLDQSPKDIVISFRCKATSFINRWKNRKRNVDWPPKQLIDMISEMNANVVGTGFAGSEMKDIEWRICFNEQEVLLVRSLNDTQAKLYVILKLVMKNILKPKKKELTSYVMKNIVFWLAEHFPQFLFNEDSLCAWLFKALRLLRWSVDNEYLPYYMIPERNLLASTLKEDQKLRVIRRITYVLNSGPACLLRCKKLTDGLVNISPEKLDVLGKRRDTLEFLELQTMTQAVEYQTGETDINEDKAFREKLLYMKLMVTLPNFMVLAAQGGNIHALNDQELKRILS